MLPDSCTVKFPSQNLWAGKMSSQLLLIYLLAYISIWKLLCFKKKIGRKKKIIKIKKQDANESRN